jgi:hypothetical protein
MYSCDPPKISFTVYRVFNWLVFVTDTGYLLRSKNWSFIRSVSFRSVSYLKGYTMSQRVSGRPLTAEVQIRSQVSPWKFVVNKVALGEVFFRVLLFSPVIITLRVSNAHIRLQIALTTRTNVRNLGTFKTVTPFRKSGNFGWKSTSNFLLFSWLNNWVFQFSDMYRFSGDA